MSIQYMSRCCDTLVFTKEGEPYVRGSLMHASEVTFADGTHPVPGPSKPSICPGCGEVVPLSSEGLYPLIDVEVGYMEGVRFINDQLDPPELTAERVAETKQAIEDGVLGYPV